MDTPPYLTKFIDPKCEQLLIRFTPKWLKHYPGDTVLQLPDTDVAAKLHTYFWSPI